MANDRNLRALAEQIAHAALRLRTLRHPPWIAALTEAGLDPHPTAARLEALEQRAVDADVDAGRAAADVTQAKKQRAAALNAYTLASQRWRTRLELLDPPADPAALAAWESALRAWKLRVQSVRAALTHHAALTHALHAWPCPPADVVGVREEVDAFGPRLTDAEQGTRDAALERSRARIAPIRDAMASDLARVRRRWAHATLIDPTLPPLEG